jgi:hypothetical protein
MFESNRWLFEVEARMDEFYLEANVSQKASVSEILNTAHSLSPVYEFTILHNEPRCNIAMSTMQYWDSMVSMRTTTGKPKYTRYGTFY